MPNAARFARDIIIRTPHFAEATHFYEQVLGLPVTYRSPTLMGFETGAFCLYVEAGESHGPVFERLVPDVQQEKARLLAAGCTIVEEDPTAPRCYLRDPNGLVFNLGRAPGDH